VLEILKSRPEALPKPRYQRAEKMTVNDDRSAPFPFRELKSLNLWPKSGKIIKMQQENSETGEAKNNVQRQRTGTGADA
jgi:hypothetical protein